MSHFFATSLSFSLPALCQTLPVAVTKTLSLPTTRFGGKLKKNCLDSSICGGDTSSSSEEEKLCGSPSAFDMEVRDIARKTEKEEERGRDMGRDDLAAF